jgi:hypothetical protein
MGSDLLRQFFTTDLHFLLGDGEQKSAHELSPFFLELFYVRIPASRR